MAPLNAFYGLTTLRLSGNAGIDFPQLRAVIDQNPGLIRIGLGGIAIGEPGVPWFNIPRDRVVELNLANTGLEGLWGIEEYAGLEVLDAAGNRINDLWPLAGGYFFGPLDQLKELDLTDLGLVQGLQ